VGKKKKKKQERFAAGRGAESRLRSFLAHPVVADVLAAGLIALANALRENRMIRQTVSKVKDKAEVVAGEAAYETAEAGSEAAEFGAILAAKAKEQARRLGAVYLGADAGGGKGKNGNGGSSDA
jgi:hypothetical protein